MFQAINLATMAVVLRFEAPNLEAADAITTKLFGEGHTTQECELTAPTAPPQEGVAQQTQGVAKVIKTNKNVCWCGCGGATNKRFVPGHDARFHGWAKKVARGQMNLDETLASLPHEEAREDFLEHVEAERPIWAKKQAAAKAEKTRKAKEKLAAAATEEDETETQDEATEEQETPTEELAEV